MIIPKPDEEEDITIITGGGTPPPPPPPPPYYPPLNPPKDIYRDTFVGQGSHDGKWIKFFTYSLLTYPPHYGGYAPRELIILGSKMGIQGDEDEGETDDVGIHVLTRAEFKTCFTTKFKCYILPTR